MRRRCGSASPTRRTSSASPGGPSSGRSSARALGPPRLGPASRQRDGASRGGDGAHAEPHARDPARGRGRAVGRCSRARLDGRRAGRPRARRRGGRHGRHHERSARDRCGAEGDAFRGVPRRRRGSSRRFGSCRILPASKETPNTSFTFADQPPGYTLRRCAVWPRSPFFPAQSCFSSRSRRWRRRTRRRHRRRPRRRRRPPTPPTSRPPRSHRSRPARS